MKTPEEIKKGLECCSIDLYRCGMNCPYMMDCHQIGAAKTLEKDALALIEQLERERDAAIEDIKKAAVFLCQTCKRYSPMYIDDVKHYCNGIPVNSFEDGPIICGLYEWRGVQER